MNSPSESTLAKICTDLSASVSPAEIVFAYGRPAGSVTHLALYMAFAGITHEKSVVFLDGGNSFDPFLISRIARRAGLEPKELLRRIHISRAFTYHQMQALVVERLAGALNRFHSSVAIVSGLLDTFYDESVPFNEAYELLKQATAELVRLAGRGARILIACPDTKLPLASRQRRLVGLLKKVSDKTLRIEGDNAKTAFALEKPYQKQYGPVEISERPRNAWGR